MVKIKNKKILFLITLVALVGFYLPYKTEAKELDAKEKMQIKEINIDIEKQLQEGGLKGVGNEYISEPIYNDFQFNALGASWDKENEIFVKIIEEEKTTEWFSLEVLEQKDGLYFSELVAADKGIAFQYKVIGKINISKINFTYIDSEFEKSKLAADYSSPTIISRHQWGADETWRYCTQWDRSKQECIEKDFSKDRWPIEYADVKKIVVHHSAGSTGDSDPAAIVRAMYFWHAITLGWGDIGYNYLVDHLGNIYEGRSGGDGAVSGHAYYSYQDTDEKIKIGYNLNHGSMGIVLLGNFNSDSVSTAAKQSLINLMTEKSKKYNLDPNDFTSWAVPITLKDFSEEENDEEEIISEQEQKARQQKLISRIPEFVWKESTWLFESRGYSYQFDLSNPIDPKIILNGVRDIITHRDIDATTCPGSNLYALMPTIKLAISDNLRNSVLAPTYTANYKTRIVGKSNSVVNIKPGEKKWIWVEYQNEGKYTWQNISSKGVVLTSSDTKNKLASINNLKIASLTESGIEIIDTTAKTEVKPGEIVRFAFQIEGPYDKKTETKTYLLAIDGKGWFPESEFSITLNVEDTDYSAKLLSENHPENISSNSATNISIKYQNAGKYAWQKGKIKLNISEENEEKSSFNYNWPSYNGYIDFAENSVQPGETATFNLKIKGSSAGQHKQVYYLTREEEKSIEIPGSRFEKTINVSTDYSAELIKANIPVATLNIWRPTASLTFKNTGAKTWDSQMVLRSYSEYTPYFKSSYFRDSSWNSTYAIDKVRAPVEPGETITFDFRIDAPNTPGTYIQIFQLEYGPRYEEIYINNDLRVIFKTRVDKAS